MKLYPERLEKRAGFQNQTPEVLATTPKAMRVPHHEAL